MPPPQPNPQQKQQFVFAWLQADRPAEALPWLEGSWGAQESTRLRLLAETLARLGRTLETGDIAVAQERLIAGEDAINGQDYGTLPSLAQALREHGCARGETVLYRALLNGVLDRTNSRAYSHAARYWLRLREIAATGTDLVPLIPHAEFAADIEKRHKRKPAFWAQVHAQQHK